MTEDEDFRRPGHFLTIPAEVALAHVIKLAHWLLWPLAFIVEIIVVFQRSVGAEHGSRTGGRGERRAGSRGELNRLQGCHPTSRGPFPSAEESQFSLYESGWYRPPSSLDESERYRPYCGLQVLSRILTSCRLRSC